MARFLASFLLMSILCTVVYCGGPTGSQFRSSSQSAPYGGRNYPRSGAYPWGSDAAVHPAETTKEPPPPEKKTGGSGLSAWGIISLIVCISMVLIAIYYFMLFYPILCRKESKYNVMDTESA